MSLGKLQQRQGVAKGESKDLNSAEDKALTWTLNPKSPSFTPLVLERKMDSAFISLWIMLRPWRYSNADKTGLQMVAICFSDNLNTNLGY